MRDCGVSKSKKSGAGITDYKKIRSTNLFLYTRIDMWNGQKEVNKCNI